jgi:leader peptidase (prepilin peptidase)/N-methyltransferase
MARSGAAALPSLILRHRWTIAAMIGGVAVSLYLLPPPQAWFAALLAALAILIAAVDLEHFIIPDSANIAIAVLGLVLVIVEAPPGALAWDLLDAVARAAAAGGVLLALRYFYGRRSGVEGLGLGDVKLAAAGATFLSWPSLPVALLIAAFGGLIAVAAQALSRRKMPSRRAELPFGAFLAPAIWLAFLIERSALLAF